jgi:hypothetical protein
LDQVEEYYSAAIEDAGWRLSRTASKPGKTEWEMVHTGGSLGRLVLAEDPAGGVSILLERMDR